ncbi:pilus-assembly fibrillin subunit [Escherichia coli]
MNGVSQADELLTRDDFFVADESRHQWVTEHNGRTGASERQRCISVISVHTGYARS